MEGRAAKGEAGTHRAYGNEANDREGEGVNRVVVFRNSSRG